VIRCWLLRLGFCFRVHPRGWYEFGDSVCGPLDLPVALVDDPVVVSAEQAPVGVAADPAVEPVFDVVRLGPAGWPVASGEGASFVSLGDCLADGGGEQSVGPADVEDLGCGAHHHGDDVGVAGEDPGFGGADRSAEFEVGGADPLAEVVVVDGDRDVRAFAAVGGGVPEVQVAVQQVFQGVPAAGGGAAPVRGAVRGVGVR